MFSALKNFIAPDGKAIKSQKIFHAYTLDIFLLTVGQNKK